MLNTQFTYSGQGFTSYILRHIWCINTHVNSNDATVSISERHWNLISDG